MKTLLRKLAEWVYKAAMANAGTASGRGSYELPVPKQLISGRDE